nr:DUF4383 domain-containing protein [Solirubrobacterales bacterium]
FGFLANAGFGLGNVPSGTVDGSSFLGFEVNGWHNIVHLASGLVLLAGIFGFLADAGFGIGNVPSGTVDGSLFLGLEVNGWHNIVHLASGLVLLAAANTRPSAKAIALAFGLVYGLVAIIGLIDGSDVLGIIPVNGADNVLHIALALLGIIAGLISKARKGHSRGGVHTPGTTDEVGDGRSHSPSTGNVHTNDPAPGSTRTQH